MQNVSLLRVHQSKTILLTRFTRENNYCFQRVIAIAILSVCPSVSLTHRSISQKRYKLGPPKFHRLLPGRL